MSKKNVVETVKGEHTSDGAGVKLVRVLGHSTTESFDPFLMLDAFDSKNPDDYIAGFPMHPHRGIETVTYLIEGEIEHTDSLGNKGVIHSNEVQWMTSGNGILHQEMPQPSDSMLGLQLWVNMPQKYKMTNPMYFDINEDKFKIVENETSTVKIIAGNYNGVQGIESKFVKVDMFDINVNPSGEFSLDIDSDKNLFIYIINGSASFGDSNTVIENKTAVRFGEGNELSLKASDSGIRFILFAGKPLKEPIAWAGPIVMNTPDEVKQAFSELHEGTFIKS